MRDIKRIDVFLQQLGEIWKEVPDWRFAQLISNFLSFIGQDVFYWEEEKFLNELKKFMEEK